MKNTLLSLFTCLLCISQSSAQNISVNYQISTGKKTPISPYVYGCNAQGDDRNENITARRLGGNRMTGYNWENNASNAGIDYNHQNDNYLTYINGINGANENKPAIVLTQFHDTSMARKTYSLVTLQSAGYVARDKNGPVGQSQTAPSSRFRQVVFKKPSSFSLTPDTSDATVYMDECVFALKSKYGTQSVQGFAFDNEPGIWSETHPRIHPNKAKCAEIIQKSTKLSSAIKTVDNTIEFFGPAMFGFSEYQNNQDAPDWNTYSNSYATWTEAYLAQMKLKSDSAGKRLLDVLDLHWYPEATGKDRNGNDQRICFGGNPTDPGVCEARMQAPRSLWDSTYKETSYITQYFGNVNLIPKMKRAINKYNPNTKLAFTEFDYGAPSHITGGIAVVDVLGIMGKYGVYMSNYWENVSDYISAAYQLYRNYDKQYSTYGNAALATTSSDIVNSSIYASTDMQDSSSLHIIIVNKNSSQSIVGNFAINSTVKYTIGQAFSFDQNSNIITQKVNNAAISNNSFQYTIPPYSAYHFVLKGQVSTTQMVLENGTTCNLYPNPLIAGKTCTLEASNLAENETYTLIIRNLMGVEINKIERIQEGKLQYAFPFPAGLYTYELRNRKEVVKTGKFQIL